MQAVCLGMLGKPPDTQSLHLFEWHKAPSLPLLPDVCEQSQKQQYSH